MTARTETMEEWAKRVVRENDHYFPTSEMVTWSCTECNETLTGIAGLQGPCDYCGEWQDAPDGSGLHYTD